MAGFRSGNSQQVQCFDQLYQDFPLLSLERSITTLEDAPEKEESLGMSSVKTIFSAMEPSLLLNYLLLSLLEEKVPGDQVQLSSKSKYKVLPPLLSLALLLLPGHLRRAECRRPSQNHQEGPCYQLNQLHQTVRKANVLS